MGFLKEIKAVLYRTGRGVLRALWRAGGGRRIEVFGQSCRLVPETVFPSYRKFRLPKGGSLSEIVRYADYVQFHAISNYTAELKDRPVIVDIGAHHGAYAVVLGKMTAARGGKVIAVEPNPESFQILSSNIFLNGLGDTVVCEKVAVSDKNGSMYIAASGSESRITEQEPERGYRVEVVTMEGLLKKNAVSHIHILIIDVEGAELPVLRSLPWNEVKIEKIFCELHPYAWRDFGYTGADMSKFLVEHGFRCFDMYFREHTVFDSEAYLGPTFFCRVG